MGQARLGGAAHLCDNQPMSARSLITPPSGLTRREEKFCLLMVSGEMSQADAYKKAGFQCKNKASGSANANRLLKKDKAARYIMALRRQIEREAIGKTLLTTLERRQFLAEAVRTPAGLVDENSRLAQSYRKRTRTVRGDIGEEIIEEIVEVKMPDKLQALKLDAILAGELSPKDDPTGGYITGTDPVMEIMLQIRVRNQTQPRTIDADTTQLPAVSAIAPSTHPMAAGDLPAQ